MPAINIVCGYRRVDIVTDTAFCDATGTIVRIISRALPGRMGDGIILAHDLGGLDLSIADRFEKFDEAIERIEHELSISSGHLNQETPRLLYLAGWSEKREETEAYAISTHPVSLTSWQPDTREYAEHQLAPCQLIELPRTFLSPAPDPSLVEAASIGRFDVTWRTDKMLSELGKVIRAQRYFKENGCFTVGGFVEKRTVDVNWGGIGLSPEMVWTDDQVGCQIIPKAQSDEGVQSAKDESKPLFFFDLKDRVSTWPAAVRFLQISYASILNEERATSYAHQKDYRFTDSSRHNVGDDEYAAVEYARALNLQPSKREMEEYERYVNRILEDLENMKGRFRIEEPDPHGYGIGTLHSISRRLAAVLLE